LQEFEYHGRNLIPPVFLGGGGGGGMVWRQVVKLPNDSGFYLVFFSLPKGFLLSGNARVLAAIPNPYLADNADPRWFFVLYLFIYLFFAARRQIVIRPRVPSGERRAPVTKWV